MTTSDDQSQFLRDFTGKLVQNTSKWYTNLSQDIILTTEDKIRISLMQYLEKLGKRKTWVTPLGIFLTIIIVFPTTTFQNFILSADTWQAIFILSGCLSLIWLLITIKDAFVKVSIDHVIDDIKRSGISQPDVLAGKTSFSDSENGDHTLEFFNRKILFNPSSEQIEKSLALNLTDEFGFALLSKEPLTYIQAIKDENVLSLEFQESSTDNHYRSLNTRLDLSTIIRIFQEYSKDGENWKSEFEWENLEL